MQSLGLGITWFGVEGSEFEVEGVDIEGLDFRIWGFSTSLQGCFRIASSIFGETV